MGVDGAVSTTTIIALVIGGFILMFVEVFLPGGVLGLLGGVALVCGILCGFIFKGPAWGTVLFVVSGLLGLVGFWLWMKFFPKTPVGRRLVLDRDARTWKGTDASRQDLTGKDGIAHSTLRPAGTALIGGVRVDVVTRGELIDAGTKIKVIVVEGNRVVVTALQ